MKTFLFGLIAVIVAIALLALVYFAAGTVFYFGLPVLGVEITFSQSVVLAILIAVTGSMFRAGSANHGKQTKGDD